MKLYYYNLPNEFGPCAGGGTWMTDKTAKRLNQRRAGSRYKWTKAEPQPPCPCGANIYSANGAVAELVESKGEP